MSQQFRLFIQNLPWTVGTQELRQYFSQFGRIRYSHVPWNNETGLSRMFGFVTFDNKEDYLTALSQKEHILDNKRLLVRKRDDKQRA